MSVRSQRDQRLVLVTRLLLCAAAFGLVSVYPGLTAPTEDPAAIQATLMGLLFLIAGYSVTLLLAGRRQWSMARAALFCTWIGYSASLLSLVNAARFDGAIGAIILSVATAFFGVSFIGIVALEEWSRARYWLAVQGFVYITLSGLCSLDMLGTEMFAPFVSAVGINFVLLSAGTLAAGSVSRDLSGAYDDSEDRRVREHVLRLEIENAMQLAQDASQAKSHFLANMSHELRTPLTAVLGYVDLISETAEDEEIHQFDDDLGRVRGAAQHLLELINSVLDLSKVEAGKMELSEEAEELNSALEALVSTMQPLARKGGNTLRGDFDLPGQAVLDGQKVRQVIINLVSNALKFTSAGTVTVLGRFEGETLVVSVTDTGIGIAPDRLEAVFESFEQAEHATALQFGGTGLGLAISRRFCELMEGELTVQSEMGVGSTFSLRVPVKRPELPSTAETTDLSASATGEAEPT